MVNVIAIPTRGNSWYLTELLNSLPNVPIYLLVKEPIEIECDREAVFVVQRNKENFASWFNQVVAMLSNDDKLIFINDDIEISKEDIHKMFDALDTAELVYVNGSEPGELDMSGDLFGIRADSGLLMDESFVFHWADLDMKLRAMVYLRVKGLELPSFKSWREGAKTPWELSKEEFGNKAYIHDIELLRNRWGNIA